MMTQSAEQNRTRTVPARLRAQAAATGAAGVVERLLADRQGDTEREAGARPAAGA
jgi:hypothetical protein